MSLPELRTHTDAVIQALEDFGLVVGDGEVPEGADPEIGYVVVYSVPGGGSTGTLEEPDADAFVIRQVTCVGISRNQAEWLADKALGLLEEDLVVEGRRCWVALDMHGGVQRDDQVDPPRFWSGPRFRLTSTPDEAS